jgi:hypothetical protein
MNASITDDHATFHGNPSKDQGVPDEVHGVMNATITDDPWLAPP